MNFLWAERLLFPANYCRQNQMALATRKSPFLNKDLLKTIDHTNLNPDATTEQIQRLCDEAIQYGFGAVCVAPSRTKIAADKEQELLQLKVGYEEIKIFEKSNSIVGKPSIPVVEVRWFPPISYGGALKFLFILMIILFLIGAAIPQFAPELVKSAGGKTSSLITD